MSLSRLGVSQLEKTRTIGENYDEHAHRLDS
jgi:hypothetical protein